MTFRTIVKAGLVCMFAIIGLGIYVEYNCWYDISSWKKTDPKQHRELRMRSGHGFLPVLAEGPCKACVSLMIQEVEIACHIKDETYTQARYAIPEGHKVVGRDILPVFFLYTAWER